MTSNTQDRAKKQKKLMAKMRIRAHRNDALFDIWSLVHLVTGILLGWVVDPFVALAVMVTWEPLEVLVLSPILARYGIEYGYESLRNSLSDIFFDVIGVALGAWVLTALLDPPFYLF